MQSSCHGDTQPADVLMFPLCLASAVYICTYALVSISLQFVDKLRIVATGGKGGDGCISLEGEKHKHRNVASGLAAVEMSCTTIYH